MIKPWDDKALEMDDDDAIEALWKETVAQDYYFAIMTNDDGEKFILINPKAYFDDTGLWFDMGLDIEHLLPDLYPVMECQYEYDGDDATIRLELVQRGFEENPVMAEY